eukprot:gnl/Carplike_NY0171/1524_a2070_433.p1 GENE.gnl/Carplike_NY0171/1524_a2070_433~~gnl/Carplike_NY0171/1524_a2070_433.p1  ORF type:complete len:1130 (+),score=217.95 gnl/Carplike_NY0171/1524_a2070_433:222-3392(+)
MAHLLAKAFPIINTEGNLYNESSRIHSSFQGVFKIPNAIQPFCTRREGYSVYVIKPEHVHSFKKCMNVEYYRIPADEAKKLVSSYFGVAADDNTASKLYFDIIRKFSEFTLGVIVEGLTSIPDRALKWLAEWLFFRPYKFVYFVGTNIFFCFSEQRDRCTVKTKPPMLLTKKDIEKELDGMCTVVSKTKNALETTVEGKVDEISPASVLHSLDSHKLEMCVDWSDLKKKDVTENSIMKCLMAGDDMFDDDVKDALGIEKGISIDSDNETFKKAALTMKRKCYVNMIVSSPGAGKTYTMEELVKPILEKAKIKYLRIDGSSDTLVRRSLIDYLNEKILSTGLPLSAFSLVIDEYHMMSTPQKVDLFDWLKGRDNMKVILIANRIDSDDITKMMKLRDDVSFDKESVKIYETRITNRRFNRIFDNKYKQSEEISILQKSQIEWYYVIACAVFGSEATSIREMNKIKDVFMSPDIEEPLLAAVHGKNPTIGYENVRMFVRGFKNLVSSFSSHNPTVPMKHEFKTYKDVATPLTLGKFKNPIECIVYLLFICNTPREVNGKLQIPDNIISIPKFLGRHSQLTKYVPAVRLQIYASLLCVYIRNRKFLEGEDSDLMEKVRLERFYDTPFMDQVGLPIMLDSKEPTWRTKTFALAWSGQYQDLDAMVEAAQRNYTFDWKVAREEWSRRRITTDIEGFTRLLSVVLDKVDCLRAVPVEDFINLLKTNVNSNSKTTAQLAENIVDHLGKEPQEEEKDLIFNAMWIAFAYSTDNKPLEFFMDKVQNCDITEPWGYEFLVWANQNVDNVFATGDLHKKTKYLQDVLVKITEHELSTLNYFSPDSSSPFQSLDIIRDSSEGKRVLALWNCGFLNLCLPISPLQFDHWLFVMCQIHNYPEPWSSTEILDGAEWFPTFFAFIHNPSSVNVGDFKEMINVCYRRQKHLSGDDTSEFRDSDIVLKAFFNPDGSFNHDSPFKLIVLNCLLQLKGDDCLNGMCGVLAETLLFEFDTTRIVMDDPKHIVSLTASVINQMARGANYISEEEFLERIRHLHCEDVCELLISDFRSY